MHTGSSTRAWGPAFRQWFWGVHERQAVRSKAAKYMSKRGPLVHTMDDAIRLILGTNQRFHSVLGPWHSHDGIPCQLSTVPVMPGPIRKRKIR